MPPFYKATKKHVLLTIFFSFCLFSSINSLLHNENKTPFDKSYLLSEDIFNIKEKTNNSLRQLAYTCATTSYIKSDIKEECDYGPSSYDRLLSYKSFSNYISSHSYHSNGLNYVTSLLVDDETHNFGNFMNDGVGMIILYIIDGLMLLGWIPLLCCWRKRCCLFDECLYADGCCVIFWHILTYFLSAAILSFLIVVLCFGE
jgi:hypothetical protein